MHLAFVISLSQGRPKLKTKVLVFISIPHSKHNVLLTFERQNMKTLWSLQRFCGCRSKFNFERRRFRPCQYYWSAPWVLLTPRKKRTKKIKNIFHEMRTIRSPFLVLTFRTFVHENRTVLVTISTDEQLGSKLRKMFSDIERRSWKSCDKRGKVYRNR